MQPCRSLLQRWACRQCCWMCDRAVGERCTTESIASIHKLYHWCEDLPTVHKIHRYAINRTKNLIFSPFSLKYIILHCASPAQYLNPSCNIQAYRNCMEKNRATYHTQTYKHVHTHQHKYRETIKALSQPLLWEYISILHLRQSFMLPSK